MKAYKNNFWKAAKDITNGTFNQPKITPTFDKEMADKFYKDKYETPTEIDPTSLHWWLPVDTPSSQYDMTPYKPGDVKRTHRNKKPDYFYFLLNTHTHQ